jgi:flagella basal body P-ring formation protein FlgA
MIADFGLRIADYKKQACGFILPVVLLLGVMPTFVSAASWDAGEVLKTYIKDHYPWAEVEVSDVRLSSEAPVRPPASITVEKTPPGRSLFRLRFADGRMITASATVKAFDQVMMSRGAFRKGHTLMREDVYATLMESARIPKGGIRSESGVYGKTLTRSIVASAPLTDAMVSETAVVKRGRRIVMYAEAPGFTVKTMGELKQDASVGEQVSVLNLASKKMIMGQLVDVDTVRVGY